MALNINFHSNHGGSWLIRQLQRICLTFALALIVGMACQYSRAEVLTKDLVHACVLTHDLILTPSSRSAIADCLFWEADHDLPICRGVYRNETITPLAHAGEAEIMADQVSFYPSGRSDLVGHVRVREAMRVVNAQTAYVYRNAKTNQINRIELLGNVRYLEPGKMMLAEHATINPNDKSGQIDHVLYRFDVNRASAHLPAWGRANMIQRFANQDYLLQKATYTTCSPLDKAWQIDAGEITLDDANQMGVARHALLRVLDWPVLYTPYLSFPTSNARKSGFLMPTLGYSNVGGFDFTLPYYLNIAPNLDATLVPHEYTLRGTMLGGDIRFLSEQSIGNLGANLLPNDRAFNAFLNTNHERYPQLIGVSNDRWSLWLHDSTQFTQQLHMNINYQQVSDNYYLQDFSSNLAILTENQLLRQGDLSYTTDHWLFTGMLQSYQTLHPVNQSEVKDAYDRLPQLQALGVYQDLPFNAHFNMLSQFDYFHWPNDKQPVPQGPRYHTNPILSIPIQNSWGYLTPEVQFVDNYYELHSGTLDNPKVVNRSIPRFSVDSGLYFDRSDSFMGHDFKQTLEPRLYYLNVPFQNQSLVPSFDSAYMIFNTEQLFRTNRFSGFDRIGDANQLAFATTSRWISDESGQEKASITVGQLRYFSNRRVKLCYGLDDQCVDDPYALGYLSPRAKSSPIASLATYRMNHFWDATAEYVWDTFTHATNNGNLNFHYRPDASRMLNVGYGYLVNGNNIMVQDNLAQFRPLHQATIAYAWPLNDQWSTLGAYSYNLSEGYTMMTFAGLQYDTCCWAFRALGGHTFQSLSPDSLTPRYNNNVYFQVLLKGLGSLAISDPASTIQSYLPGYPNIFQH